MLRKVPIGQAWTQTPFNLYNPDAQLDPVIQMPLLTSNPELQDVQKVFDKHEKQLELQESQTLFWELGNVPTLHVLTQTP